MGQMNRISKNNTKVSHNADGSIAVRLHNTNVVTIENGTITLDSGGWKTVTTKARMNQVANELNLPYRVFQEDHSWFVRIFESNPRNFAIGHTLPFDDRSISFKLSCEDYEGHAKPWGTCQNCRNLRSEHTASAQ
jgi:hypothetical protein